jgi:hypothetical protein
VDDSDLLTNAEARIQKLKRLKPEKATNQPSRGKRTQSYWSIFMKCKIKAALVISKSPANTLLSFMVFSRTKSLGRGNLHRPAGKYY